MVHELGLKRCKTVLFLSATKKTLKILEFSTRGPINVSKWLISYFVVIG